MFHTLLTPKTAARATASDPTPLHIFVQDHLNGLAHAAFRLAGQRGARLVADLLDGLSRRPTLNRALKETAREVLEVLSLEHVHDPQREEAVRFAMIDPADPIIEEICLLTDEFRRALDQAVADHPPVRNLRPVA